MTTFFNKTLLMILLCLIFIGQSTASMTMFYSMTSMQSMPGMSSENSPHQHMTMSANSKHQMSAMAECDESALSTTSCETTSTEECCAQECDCLTSSCSTVSAFSTVIAYTPIFAITSKITSLRNLVASQALTSLYRPPILS